jgi:hypothetical protein
VSRDTRIEDYYCTGKCRRKISRPKPEPACSGNAEKENRKRLIKRARDKSIVKEEGKRDRDRERD